MKYCRMPTIWPGKTVFIIGGGPSISELNLDLIRKQKVIGINSAFRLGNWIDVIFFNDKRWLKIERSMLIHYPGLIVSTAYIKDLKLNILRAYRSGIYGISKDPRVLRFNESSGGAAINLAVHFGAKRIVLLGYDMKKVGDRHNFHNVYQENLERDPYPRYLVPFKQIKEDADELGVEIINATVDSAIDVFQKMTLEEAIADSNC